MAGAAEIQSAPWLGVEIAPLALTLGKPGERPYILIQTETVQFWRCLSDISSATITNALPPGSEALRDLPW
jgi:hypothetical protein